MLHQTLNSLMEQEVVTEKELTVNEELKALIRKRNNIISVISLHNILEKNILIVDSFKLIFLIYLPFFQSVCD